MRPYDRVLIDYHGPCDRRTLECMYEMAGGLGDPDHCDRIALEFAAARYLTNSSRNHREGFWYRVQEAFRLQDEQLADVRGWFLSPEYDNLAEALPRIQREYGTEHVILVGDVPHEKIHTRDFLEFAARFPEESISLSGMTGHRFTKPQRFAEFCSPRSAPKPIAPSYILFAGTNEVRLRAAERAGLSTHFYDTVDRLMAEL